MTNQQANLNALWRQLFIAVLTGIAASDQHNWDARDRVRFAVALADSAFKAVRDREEPNQ